MNKKEEAGLSILVKVVARLMTGLILLYGIYIIVHGHVTPGGGFAGGLILALAFINLMLAYGKNGALQKLSKPVAGLLERISSLAFLTIALLGFAVGYFFLSLLALEGKPFDFFSAAIQFVNIEIFLKVGAGLFVIFVVLALIKIGERE